MLGRMTQHFERESPLFIILTIELHIQGDRPKEKAVGMEDDAAPLGDVAGGTMVEAGGGERTGTADWQNQQSSTNSKAEQHEQQQSNREEEESRSAQQQSSTDSSRATERRSTTVGRRGRRAAPERHLNRRRREAARPLPTKEEQAAEGEKGRP